MSDTLINVEGVSKKFCRSLKRSLWYGMQDLGSEILGLRHGGNAELRADEFWAVKDVCFELKRGECLGLIGRNGAGKTTLLKMLTGLIKLDKGRIEMRGRVGGLIALGAGFNPILSGKENLYVNASVLGLTKREIDEKYDEIVAFADLGDSMDMPVQNYSSGMQVRLGFAVATTLEPDILILDEVLAVGDAKFRNKCYNKIGKMHMQAATIFVSHSMDQIAQVCDKVLVMDQGKVLHIGDLGEGIDLYESLNSVGEDGESKSFETIIPPVEYVDIRLSPRTVSHGSSAVFEMEIVSSEQIIDAKLRIVCYSDIGVPFAEWNNSRQGIHFSIPAGRSIIRLTLGPINFKAGCYLLGVNLNNNTGLSMLCWSFKKHRIEVDSVTKVGPSIALQSGMEVVVL